ncbi:bifunctional 3,4-dihydroxy-2-butanone 4-phosphate synthase/GTP cyclohydrolase II [Helicobacter sp. 12S02634-8]|uniref:bifunctional 3,4-dihydroxy-2-butanone 4-phosphate synthase/GTP cyclohydrolase II n=1 Tax=Helicobacter sp. 12S02634-8 TaxID=1476199 RepID=UPI000BA6AE66|nr:bifunctional 3,4-dihydroxy-2-butanone 4-phosphate synthase/GTP cyclohydrolase II [Helicobacter sp. 12S02634-8]PAF48057.1 bifunctional 3,4-dihydroxy-2-butanone 4-phosphate synthase/GTP cyclohydrolase II [Helicobacter sp. 12S02634-8]
MHLQRVREAIKAIKNGEMIIIMDDEDRENEGDLVMAGIFSTPEKINFMAQEARGLICVSITKEIAQKFDLPPMVSNNNSNHETAFTVSIDAKEAKTGISAFERHRTIELMCDTNTTPQDFVRPGHIFPLIAKDGGVLVRTGHTEASVDICKLAGLKPVSVICEIMKADGSMARRGDKFLIEFAQKHHLKILYVSDLISYRLQNETLLEILSETPSEFLATSCVKITFADHLQREHFAFGFGRSTTPLIRFHTIKSDYQLLSEQQNYEFLMRSIAKIKQEGGYLIFINDHSSNHANSPSSSGELIKSFGIGAQILKLLQVKDFRLITSSNVREYNALSGFGLQMIESIQV